MAVFATVARLGLCELIPRKRAFPCSFRRSKASWKLGASRRSTLSQEWMWRRSR
jgi:hypothetical protein